MFEEDAAPRAGDEIFQSESGGSYDDPAQQKTNHCFPAAVPLWR
ncbi:MAG TPA: hypothetical protein VE175_15225 [Woeseiaceae bacterium]|jgi:hypothetical protein|nr:hypothetical protein [Woeseiaceae bacterium]